jgi:hypothetical protein
VLDLHVHVVSGLVFDVRAERDAHVGCPSHPADFSRPIEQQGAAPRKPLADSTRTGELIASNAVPHRFFGGPQPSSDIAHEREFRQL